MKAAISSAADQYIIQVQIALHKIAFPLCPIVPLPHQSTHTLHPYLSAPTNAATHLLWKTTEIEELDTSKNTEEKTKKYIELKLELTFPWSTDAYSEILIKFTFRFCLGLYSDVVN
ncbi:hypothetical protein ACB094_08G151000 [Castanea mollissima]